jgi:hypothetical protein
MLGDPPQRRKPLRLDIAVYAQAHVDAAHPFTPVHDRRRRQLEPDSVERNADILRKGEHRAEHARPESRKQKLDGLESVVRFASDAQPDVTSLRFEDAVLAALDNDHVHPFTIAKKRRLLPAPPLAVRSSTPSSSARAA